MKIRELLEAMVEPVEKVLSPLPHDWDMDELEKQEFTTTQGSSSGWYSAGSEIEDKPHEYKVTTHYPTRLDVDGKYYWVQACKKNTDNPYLPQYYNIDLQPDSSGKIRTSYTMERLWDINDLEKHRTNIEVGDRKIGRGELIGIQEEQAEYLLQQLVSMAQQMFNDPELISHYNFPKQFYDRQIIAPIRNAIYSPITASQWDPKLLEAIELIRNILNDKRFELDFHASNALLRNTSFGLQMVITDPISDAGKSIIKKPPAYLYKSS